MHKHASTNRFYRLVWSHVHSCWIAVAEGARGRGKSAARKLSAVLLGAAAGGAAIAAPPGPAGFAPPALKALADTPSLPAGAQVVAGQASVATNGSQMTVYQGSDKAILNWQSFDIGAQAGVRFVQPGSQSVALNRVLGNDPSRIHGKLDANGKVFLVNQNGVLFGASARVDVGGLVASSLALPDGDFLAGRYTFSGSSSAGAVRNEGRIDATSGGYVALLGPNVSNAGSIVAANGSVVLGAGAQLGIDLRGDGLITLRVDRGALQAIAENSGLVQADGGRVEFSASGADALARATVNNTGIVQARGLAAQGGSIRLVGDGEVHAGALDASSGQGRGGQVTVEGHFVALDGAIDASGDSGGGVSVRADSMLSNAASTSAAGRSGVGGTVALRSGGALVENSSATVDASGAAKGGSIAVHGEGSVLSSASYSASSAQGDGGRIDVSGSDVRLLGTRLDASGATQGGLVRVGGAFQGGAVREDAPDLARFVTRWGQAAPIASATSTFVGDNTAIDVAATGRAGQGGTAVIWSERQTTMLGSIDARGAGAGAAGTVEISSKDNLRHVGLDKIALGSGGQLLLDPKNIIIGGGGPAAGQWTYQAVMGKGYSGGSGSDPANVEQGDAFGMAVALNAAGDRMAVGAPYADGAGGDRPESGAVHLFSFSGADFSGATLQGTLGAGYTGVKNLDVVLPDSAQFGGAVALNADATRLAVGAPLDGTGAVRLFSFGDSTFAAPALTHTLGAGYGSANLGNAVDFGSAVALNAAGNRLAVGAMSDTGNGSCNACGAVYLFNNAVASPSFVKAIGAGYGANIALPLDAQFGTSVAFDGAGDKLAVGAFGVDDARGAVYLFTDAYGATNRVATIGNGSDKSLNVPLLNGESFAAVALNAAGTRLAVGATGTGDTGSVRIIDFTDSQFGSPFVSATLGSGNTEGAGAAAGLETGEWFGYSVALNGAGDRLLVGSPLSDGNLSDNGGYGTVRAFKLNMSSLDFGKNPAADVTVNAGMLANALDNGTSITLQANNDITLAAGNAIVVGGASGNGSLTLQAGRSIALNSSITTGNANLTLVANETVAHGVANAYRDAGAATIDVAAGTTINAGSGRVEMTVADGAGKTNRASGAITLGGNVLAGSASIKNLGTSTGSNVTIGSSGSITGTANGLIEIAATNASSAFINTAVAGGLNPGAGRYLVYSNNPNGTLEGVSGYKKHYDASYTGSAPAYAGSGNWFLYSFVPVLNVSASAQNRVYDGTGNIAGGRVDFGGFIDGDSLEAGIVSGNPGLPGFSKNVGDYTITQGSIANSLGYRIVFQGSNFSITPRTLTATPAGVNKVYNGNTGASIAYSDNRVSGDNLSYSQSAAFADKQAGNAKPVTVSGITLGGADAGNYVLAVNNVPVTADITPRLLNLALTGLDKEYDGNALAGYMLVDDRLSGDVFTRDTYASASFADKTAGSNKPVLLSGLLLEGRDAGNYRLATSSMATTATITKRLLTVSPGALDKIYDGTTSAQLALDDDRVSGDVLDLAATASFANSNAGSNKLATVSSLAMAGRDAGNYTLALANASSYAAITPKALTASVAGVSKTYDGNSGITLAAGQAILNGFVAGQGATVAALAAQFNSADVLQANSVLASLPAGAVTAANGTLLSNYVLPASVGGAASITPRTLAVSAAGVNKIYDGNTGANVVLSDNRITGDALSFSQSAVFVDKRAGSAKPVNVTGITLGGADAGNYVLASNTASATAAITPRLLTVSADGIGKEYDGSAAASVTLTDDRVAGDVLAYDSAASASFADKTAGANKTVLVSGLALAGQDAANYQLAAGSVATRADIAQRVLNASASAFDKVYDGNTAAQFTLSDDRLMGDVLALDAGGASFASSDAGARAVTVTGLHLTGQDAANYTLAATSAATSATITPKALTASLGGSVSKVYDGTTGITLAAGQASLGGFVAGQGATVGALDAQFDSANVLQARGVQASLPAGAVTAANGTLLANYVLPASVSGAGSVTPRTLAPIFAGVNKTYDGNTDASVTWTDNRIGGDLLSISQSVAFADKQAGAAKPINVTGITLGGADASNYVLASNTASASAAITPRLLDVVASGIGKVYDGNTGASVTLTDNRIGGDLLAYGQSAAFADKHAGSAKPVSVTGITLGGADAGNYVLASNTASTTATITPRLLNVAASGIGKEYDGSAAANVTLTDDRIAGDVLAYASSASFSDKTAGTGKAIQVSGLALAGQDAGNYQLAAGTLATSADIAKRVLNASASAFDKVYDGNTSARFTLGDDRVAGDVLALDAGGASFASSDAGTRAVTVSSLAISGQDAANYTLASTSIGATAAITPKALTASLGGSVSKVYDGNTGITLAPGQASLSGFVAGQGATVGALAAQFDSANVLQARAVQASLAAGAVSAADGTLLANYLLPASVSGAASITPKALSVSGMRADAKVYDGTTGATLASIGTLDGLVAGDSLRLSGPTAVRFDNRDAGSGKTVSASGYAIHDGASGLAANYALAGSASASDGRITQATLTVKANDSTRLAGQDNPAFGYSVSGLVAGDSAALLPQFALATSANAQSAPGSYAITVASPATLQNYQLAYVNGVLDVTGPAPELGRVVRAAIAPVLTAEAANDQCALPGSVDERVAPVPLPGSPAPLAAACATRSVATLSGNPDIVVRNGGVRTAP